MDTLAKDLLSQLVCPVCTEYIPPPIRMCGNGHNICNTCLEKLQECPTCKGKFINARNVKLEKLTDKVQFPCKYRENGCDEAFPIDVIAEHHKECSHRLPKCPFFMTDVKCSWEGPAGSIKEHVKAAHTEPELSFSVKGKYKAGLPNFGVNIHWYQCVFTLGEAFFLWCRVIDDFLYIAFLYGGSKENASNYKYSVSMEARDGIGNVSCCYTTESFADDIDEMFRKGKCAVFHPEFAKLCVNKENWLLYEVEIFASS